MFYLKFHLLINSVICRARLFPPAEKKHTAPSSKQNWHNGHDSEIPQHKEVLLPLIPFVPWGIIYDSHCKCKPDIYKWQTERPNNLLQLDLQYPINLLMQFQHNQETFKKHHGSLTLYLVKLTYETISQIKSNTFQVASLLYLFIVF